VLAAIITGGLIGYFAPATGVALKPLGDGFIALIKMLIAPIVFATVVTGIAKMGDLKKVGRVGLKGLIYFEILTTLALGIGLAVGKTLQPGAGMNVNPATLDARAIANYTSSSRSLTTTDFLVTTTCGATLAPASSCFADVSLRPVGFGPRQGLLLINSNAVGSPVSVALSGSGCRPFSRASSRLGANFGCLP